MKKYTIDDITDNCLVTFKKHNGRGNAITYRTVFVTAVYDNSCFYDYFSGEMSFTKYDLEDAEIIDIKQFRQNANYSLDYLGTIEEGE